MDVGEAIAVKEKAVAEREGRGAVRGGGLPPAKGRRAAPMAARLALARLALRGSGRGPGLFISTESVGFSTSTDLVANFKLGRYICIGYIIFGCHGGLNSI